MPEHADPPQIALVAGHRTPDAHQANLPIPGSLVLITDIPRRPTPLVPVNPIPGPRRTDFDTDPRGAGPAAVTHRR